MYQINTLYPLKLNKNIWGVRGEKVKGNVSSFVVSLHKDRWLLELVGDDTVRYKNIKSLYGALETNIT